LTAKDTPDILTLEEVAQYLRKSKSWVYKNWRILGGVKLKGSLFFPGKEELYERIFGKREGMEVRLHPEGNQVYRSLVQDKERGKACRTKKKGGDRGRGDGSKGIITAEDNPNRHGLLGAG